jgi:hypothetical protein
METSLSTAELANEFPGRAEALAALHHHGRSIRMTRLLRDSSARVDDPAAHTGESAAAALPFHSRVTPRYATPQSTGRTQAPEAADRFQRMIGRPRKPQSSISQGRIARLQKVPTYDQVVRSQRKKKAQAMQYLRVADQLEAEGLSGDMARRRAARFKDDDAMSVHPLSMRSARVQTKRSSGGGKEPHLLSAASSSSSSDQHSLKPLDQQRRFMISGRQPKKSTLETDDGDDARAKTLRTARPATDIELNAKKSDGASKQSDDKPKKFKLNMLKKSKLKNDSASASDETTPAPPMRRGLTKAMSILGDREGRGDGNYGMQPQSHRAWTSGRQYVASTNAWHQASLARSKSERGGSNGTLDLAKTKRV